LRWCRQQAIIDRNNVLQVLLLILPLDEGIPQAIRAEFESANRQRSLKLIPDMIAIGLELLLDVRQEVDPQINGQRDRLQATLKDLCAKQTIGTTTKRIWKEEEKSSRLVVSEGLQKS